MAESAAETSDPSPDPGPHRPRTRIPSAERRARILAAARDVFMRSGFAGARVREISRAADINEALLYRHFPSKEALFEAAIAEPLEAMVERLIQVGVDSRPFIGHPSLRRQKVIDLLDELLEVMLELAPLLGVVLFADPDRGRVFYNKHLAPSLDRLAEAIDATAGSWEHRDFPARLVVTSAIGTCLMLAIDNRFGGPLLDDREQVVRALADNILAGLETATVPVSEPR